MHCPRQTNCEDSRFNVAYTNRGTIMRKSEQDEIQAGIAEDAIQLAAMRRKFAGTAEPGDAFILAKFKRDYAVAKAEFEAIDRRPSARFG
jgi:hypothetical protein